MNTVITFELAFAVIAAVAVIASWVKNSSDGNKDVLERLTRLEAKLDTLSTQVEKHNKVVERTFKLENDLNTAFNHIDVIRDDVRDIKIGGTE